MRETWYVLEDGSPGDPDMIGIGADGRYVHRDGRRVAYGPHGPMSRSVDAEVERAGYATREMTPERPRGTYKTRQVKG